MQYVPQARIGYHRQQLIKPFGIVADRLMAYACAPQVYSVHLIVDKGGTRVN